MTAPVVKPDTAALVAKYVERNPHSHAQFMRAQEAMPGGNTRSGVHLDPFPPYIERASGVHLYDIDGHQLLDFTFNNSSMLLGHAHPAVVEAIHEAASRGTGYNRPTIHEIDLAELLSDRVASLENVRFCNSGTEAVILAIRAAIGFTGKRGIGKFEGAYHGTGDHAMVSLIPPIGAEISGTAPRPNPVPSSVGLSSAADDVVVFPFNDLAACEALLREHAHNLAALIIDPLMTNAGVLMPAPGFLEGLRRITAELGILLIFDEIVSFRVASGGAQALFNVRPDLTTLGKVAAGGTAGGVFGGRADVMAQFDPRQAPKIPQAGTFNANPITTSAALATLRVLTPDIYERMAVQAKRVADELAGAFAEAGIEASTRSVGSIFKLYFSATPPATYRDNAREDKVKQRWLLLWLLVHDIHWHQNGYTSVVTEDSHLDQLISAVRQAIREM